jgi:hypothetical protein
MVLSKAVEPPDLVVVTVGGVLTTRDQAEMVRWVRDAIATTGAVRVLVRLEDFAGWRHEPALDAASLWLQDGEPVSRMAIVGDAARRGAVLTAIAQSIRTMPIEYFGTESAARTWLAASS